MRKFALTIAAILVMGSAFGQVWSYDWHGAAFRLPNENLTMKDGFLYTSGYFTNYLTWVDADPTIGVDSLFPVSLINGFVSKIDTIGNYHWAIPLYGHNMEIKDVKVDKNGNVFVLGVSGQTDFDLDPSINVAGPINGFPTFYFLAAYDQNGDYLTHFEFYHTSYRIAIDDSDDIYITGQYQGLVDFDFTSGTDTIRASTYVSYYVSKIDLINNQYIWTKTFGGTDTLTDGWIEDIEIIGSKIAMVGAFQGSDIDLNPWGNTFIAANLGTDGTRATFISILDTAGNFIDGASISGMNYDFQPLGISLAQDASIDIAATSMIDNDTLFVSSNGQISNIYSGVEESTTLIRFSASLAYEWSRVITSSGYSLFLEVDGNNDYVYLAGFFNDTLFQIENGVYRTLAVAQPGIAARTLIGYQSDGTLMGIERDSSLSSTPTTVSVSAKGIEIASNGDLYISANVSSTINAEFDLDPSQAIVSTTLTDTANYLGASYILKLNFNGFVNTQNPEAPAKVVAYPNPAKQDLRIQSESPFDKVTLQDLQGRVLMSQTFDAAKSHMLDLSAISSGVYLLTIEGESGRVTSKIVKQ